MYTGVNLKLQLDLIWNDAMVACSCLINSNRTNKHTHTQEEWMVVGCGWPEKKYPVGRRRWVEVTLSVGT